MTDPKELSGIISGDVETSDRALTEASHDASLFEVRPQAVVYPKNVEDLRKLVSYAASHEGTHLTGRSAGTDMSGGPLTESIVVSFTKYFNHIKGVVEAPQGRLPGRYSDVEISGYAITEPGVYYRDMTA